MKWRLPEESMANRDSPLQVCAKDTTRRATAARLLTPPSSPLPRTLNTLWLLNCKFQHPKYYTKSGELSLHLAVTVYSNSVVKCPPGIVPYLLHCVPVDGIDRSINSSSCDDEREGCWGGTGQEVSRGAAQGHNSATAHPLPLTNPLLRTKGYTSMKCKFTLSYV